MPDWLLEQIFLSTRDMKAKIDSMPTFTTTRTMNSNTLKLIAACLAGGILGYVIGRLSAPFALAAAEEEEPVAAEEPRTPPAHIEQIDTTRPFNDKKFNPIVDDKNYIIGFMYKPNVCKTVFPQPTVVPTNLPTIKIEYPAFDVHSTDLLL